MPTETLFPDETRQVVPVPLLPFQGKLDSAELKAFLDGILTSMQQADTVLRQHLGLESASNSGTLLELMRIREQLLALTQRLGALEGLVPLKPEISGILAQLGFAIQDMRTQFVSMADDSQILPSVAGARSTVDYAAGLLTLGVERQRSLFVAETSGGSQVAGDVEVLVTDSVNGGGKVEETTRLSAVNEDVSQPYIRQVLIPYKSETSRVSVTLDCMFSKGLASFLVPNLIELIPLPEMACEIESISLLSSNGISTPIDPEEYGRPTPGAIRIHIPGSTASGIRVKISTERWVVSQGQKKFVLGLRKVGAYQVTYLNSGSAVVEVKPLDGSPIMSLNGLTFNLSNPDNRSLLEKSGGDPAPLCLQVFSVRGGNRTPVFDTDLANILPTEPIEFSTPADSLQIQATLRKTSTVPVPTLHDITVLYRVHPQQLLPLTTGVPTSLESWLYNEEPYSVATAGSNLTVVFGEDGDVFDTFVVYVNGMRCTPGANHDYTVHADGKTITLYGRAIDDVIVADLRRV